MNHNDKHNNWDKFIKNWKQFMNYLNYFQLISINATFNENESKYTITRIKTNIQLQINTQ